MQGEGQQRMSGVATPHSWNPIKPVSVSVTVRAEIAPGGGRPNDAFILLNETLGFVDYSL